MRRWNGWGDEQTDFPLKPSAQRFLRELIGAGQRLPDATLVEVMARVPPT